MIVLSGNAPCAAPPACGPARGGRLAWPPEASYRPSSGPRLHRRRRWEGGAVLQRAPCPSQVAPWPLHHILLVRTTHQCLAVPWFRRGVPGNLTRSSHSEPARAAYAFSSCTALDVFVTCSCVHFQRRRAGVTRHPLEMARARRAGLELLDIVRPPVAVYLHTIPLL